MPIYEYLCDDCGQRYERIVMSRTQSVACPKCASTRQTVQLSVFAAPSSGSKSTSNSSPAPSSGGSCCGGGGCGCH